MRTYRCPTPYTKQYWYVLCPSGTSPKEEIYSIPSIQREERASQNIVPAQNQFLSNTSAQQDSTERRKRYTANHAPAGEGYPVGKIEPVLDTFHHLPPTTPSHRPTNRIQSAASASLWADSASHHHSLASRGYGLPCTEDESFLEVISVFENINEVLDWSFWAERGGVEGGVGLTDIRVGE